MASITIGTNVTSLGSDVFGGSRLSRITIPASVTSIGSFGNCPALTGVWFQGNPPKVGSFLSSGSTVTIYYLPGTTGWGTTFGGFSTALWSMPVPYNYTTNDGTITITGYFGPGGVVRIPDMINGLPVTSIGPSAFEYNCSLTGVVIPNGVINIDNYAFSQCESLMSVTIPDGLMNIGSQVFVWCLYLPSVTVPASVTNIGGSAFNSCLNLTSVYFKGNPPKLGANVFFNASSATVYHVPCTPVPGPLGWGKTFGGRPTVLWNPQAQTSDANFGVQADQFGFNITGSSNLVIVVEACTDLANPVWSVVGTNTLNTFIGTNGTSYFSDPQWTNYPGRSYRLRSP
jgi:hypothetical protein